MKSRATLQSLAATNFQMFINLKARGGSCFIRRSFMAEDFDKKGQQSGQPGQQGQGQHGGQPGQQSGQHGSQTDQQSGQQGQQQPKKPGQGQSDEDDQNRDRQRRAS
jgi:hypothetical protein